jgi:hypothetical protein
MKPITADEVMAFLVDAVARGAPAHMVTNSRTARQIWSEAEITDLVKRGKLTILVDAPPDMIYATEPPSGAGPHDTEDRGS